MPKKVLFLVPYVPNLIRVRPFNLIRGIAGRGHAVTLLTLWVISLRLPAWRVLLNAGNVLPTRRPLQSEYSWHPALARSLEELTRAVHGNAFDVVHVEHLRGVKYGLTVKQRAAARGQRLPVLWDSVDSISLLFRQSAAQSRNLKSRALSYLDLGRTRRYEAWLPGQFDQVTVTSSNDRRALLELAGGVQPEPEIAVLPNGVDLDYFTPNPAQPRSPDTLVVSGKMSYHANVTMVLQFCEQVLPLIWQRRPQVRLEVVGKDPTPELLSLARNPQITVTGTVPHLPPYLQRAAVAVAPIAYGAGIQNKVLEAMACETPVVVSSQAISTWPVRRGEGLLAAGEAPGMGPPVVRPPGEPELRDRVGRAGRCYVETHHHWGNVAARLDELYDRAIRRAMSQSSR